MTTHENASDTTESQTRVVVTGMTCGHCVAAVTEELSALPEVTAVDVDLHPGEDSGVTITSQGPLDPAVIEAAVTEAGYAIR